jgi:predicted ArsR family transcriptional regulator
MLNPPRAYTQQVMALPLPHPLKNAALVLPDGQQRTKARVLQLLQSHEYSAQEIAIQLGLTSPGVRRHLGDLEQLGLIGSRQCKPQGRGRPQSVYSATPQNGHSHANQSSEQSYADLCNEVMGHLATLYGSTAVLEVFSARNAQLLQRWSQRVIGENLHQRLLAMVEVLNEMGYSAQLYQENGSLYLKEQHCPALAVAQHFDELCHSEHRLYESLLGTKLVLEQTVVGGGTSCCYRITDAKADAS